MTRELYELRGAEPDLLFSPYCWRVRLALLHKGLEFVSRPVRFTDKAELAFSGQKLVPVLREDDRVVHDSLAIFRYLDEAYPRRPLLGDPTAYQRAKVIERLTFMSMRMPLLKILVPRVHAVIDPADRDYFRRTREQAFGQTLEAFADPSGGTQQFREALEPLERLLAEHPYLDGEAAGGVDYLIMGLLLWAWCLGAQPWEEASAVGAWFRRLLAWYEQGQGPIKRAAL